MCLSERSQVKSGCGAVSLEFHRTFCHCTSSIGSSMEDAVVLTIAYEVLEINEED